MSKHTALIDQDPDTLTLTALGFAKWAELFPVTEAQ